jgi:membrane-associated phospholipid phosphatase
VTTHWSDVLLVVVLATLGGFIYLSDVWEYFMEKVLERDPTLSRPWVDPTVSEPLAVILGLSPPIWTVIFVIVMRSRCHKSLRGTGLDNVMILIFAFLHAFFFSFLTSAFLWKFTGRPRPNFFAFCNYKGYYDAQISGDYSSYLNRTDPNAFVDHKECHPIYNLSPYASFPSGHASHTFATFTLASFIIVTIIHRLTPGSFLRGLVIYLHLMASGIIAFSRVRDYFHSHDDIVAGMIIGFASGAMAYLLHYHDYKISKDVDKPVEEPANPPQQANIEAGDKPHAHS